jgi:hypothetical protein
MYKLTKADIVWNRACNSSGKDIVKPRAGDIALSSLLLVHGQIMNSGVLYAVEILTPSELNNAKSGYCYYGFDSLASLLSHARQIFEADKDSYEYEALLDKQYADIVPKDSTLAKRFEKHFRDNPDEYAPL